MLIFHDAQQLGRFSRLHPHCWSVFSSAPVFSLLVPGSWNAEGESHGSGKWRDQRPGAGLRSRLFVIWSKVSQKEKNKYHILMHIYIERESRTMVLMKLFQGRNGDMDIENRLVDTVEEGGGRVN